ncbi:MAG: sigma-70 family RNA polymerase sigma factor [Opitutales bacterium]
MTENDIVTILLRERMRLSAYAWSIVRDTHVVEDLIQEVIVKALANRNKIKDEGHLRAWARTTTRNQAIDFLRKHRGRVVTLEDETLEMLHENMRSRESAGTSARKDALHMCISKLPEKSRNVLNLRYQEGLRGVAVADRLNRTVDAIYQTLSRLHKQLRKCIESRLAVEAAQR